MANDQNNEKNEKNEKNERKEALKDLQDATNASIPTCYKAAIGVGLGIVGLAVAGEVAKDVADTRARWLHPKEAASAPSVSFGQFAS